MLVLGLMLACKRADDSDAPADTEVAETDDTEVVDSDTDLDMPEDPRPLVIEVQGAFERTLTFDTPTCGHGNGVPTFRAFWRGPGHTFVLVAEIIGDYTGPGTYDPSLGRVGVKLQEEAGGDGNYFYSDTGDEVSITIDVEEETRAWGSFTVGELSGGGPITLDPATIPIWCDVLN